MSNMLKGALHIHSTFSDGELSLGELREVYLAAGCRFACVTDHADWFEGEAGLAEYVARCAAHSDNRFIFIPGLEYPCTDRMHILGYGVTAPTGASDPEAVIGHITRNGGVSVIAHPKNSHFAVIERLSELPQGLEVWNSKYDGRYAPRPETFELLRRLRVRKPNLHAFYGQDLHWRTQYRQLYVQLALTEPSRDTVLSALREGAFSGEKDGVHLPSTGVFPDAMLDEMARTHRRSERLRRLLKSAKRAADRLGLSVPRRVKAHARRVM